jgi:hypothetical protein
VDFPEDFGCHLDIRTLLEKAFVERAEEAGDTRFSGVKLGLEGAMSREFFEKDQQGFEAKKDTDVKPQGGKDEK